MQRLAAEKRRSFGYEVLQPHDGVYSTRSRQDNIIKTKIYTNSVSEKADKQFLKQDEDEKTHSLR